MEVLRVEPVGRPAAAVRNAVSAAAKPAGFRGAGGRHQLGQGVLAGGATVEHLLEVVVGSSHSVGTHLIS